MSVPNLIDSTETQKTPTTTAKNQKYVARLGGKEKPKESQTYSLLT